MAGLHTCASSWLQKVQAPGYSLFLLQGCPLTEGLTIFQFIGFDQKKQANKPP